MPDAPGLRLALPPRNAMRPTSSAGMGGAPREGTEALPDSPPGLRAEKLSSPAPDASACRREEDLAAAATATGFRAVVGGASTADGRQESRAFTSSKSLIVGTLTRTHTHAHTHAHARDTTKRLSRGKMPYTYTQQYMYSSILVLLQHNHMRAARMMALRRLQQQIVRVHARRGTRGVSTTSGAAAGGAGNPAQKRALIAIQCTMMGAVGVQYFLSLDDEGLRDKVTEEIKREGGTADALEVQRRVSNAAVDAMVKNTVLSAAIVAAAVVSVPVALTFGEITMTGMNVLIAGMAPINGVVGACAGGVSRQQTVGDMCGVWWFAQGCTLTVRTKCTRHSRLGSMTLQALPSPRRNQTPRGVKRSSTL